MPRDAEARVAANELRRSITALALELPAAVWDDVKTKADAVLDENEQLQARIGCLLAFARPVDIQAAERHIAEHGLVDAEGRRLV